MLRSGFNRFFFHAFYMCVSAFQVPYKIKEVELEYDSYNQVPESPIGRDVEPHLYMVPKKYRKVPNRRIRVHLYCMIWCFECSVCHVLVFSFYFK